jgi:hypothetical protein
VIDQLASVGLVDTNPDLLLQLLSCDQQTDCFTDRLIPGRKPAGCDEVFDERLLFCG